MHKCVKKLIDCIDCRQLRKIENVDQYCKVFALFEIEESFGECNQFEITLL